MTGGILQQARDGRLRHNSALGTTLHYTVNTAQQHSNWSWSWRKIFYIRVPFSLCIQWMPSQSVLIGYFVQCPPLFIPMKDRMIISLNILQFHLFIRMWRAGKFYNAACRLIQNIYDRCKLLSTDWETASNWSKQGVLYMITHHHHQSASIPSSLAATDWNWKELKLKHSQSWRWPGALWEKIKIFLNWNLPALSELLHCQW